jgi:hypothetical protein
MKQRRRHFVLSGHFVLEERVVMSTIGWSPIQPSAQVGGMPHHGHGSGHGSVHMSPAGGESAAHGVSRPAKHLNSPGVIAPTAKRWSWLAHTYWYVPPANLPATLFDSSTGTVSPVSDQTVYEITGYRNGYFWGKTVTQLGSASASSSMLVGSVTPQGDVLLTFTSTEGGSSPSVTQGYGRMRRHRGRWSMENQMFTSPTETLQIGHWAYMMQTRPGRPSWRSLPGSGLSVPAFLSRYEGSAPRPIG